MRMRYLTPKITGETVYVSFRTLIGYDEFGDEVWDYAEDIQTDNPDTWGDLLRMSWGGGRTQNDDVSPTGGLIQVDNVLVNPSTTTYDRFEDGHPEQIECDLILYFPRDWDRDMRGARIYVRGVRYDVTGDPERYTDANLPQACDWNMVVKVVRFDG